MAQCNGDILLHNFILQDGNNLLMAAVTFNQLEIFKILISSKSIDINWQNKVCDKSK